MISIDNDDYQTIFQVDRTRLSETPLTEIDPAIFEKDLLIIKTLALLQNFNWDEFSIVFCGGTSLSKGHRLIRRMSEDIDFKIIIPSSLSRSQSRRKLGKLRNELGQYLQEAGFNLNLDSCPPNNENRHFEFPLGYESQFPPIAALRPEIKLEFTARSPRLPTSELQVNSLLSEVIPQRGEQSISLAILAYEETLVEKVVAFLRRTASWSEEGSSERKRNPEDERLVRHLYDVHQILKEKPNTGKGDSLFGLRNLFQEIVESDQTQYRKDKTFSINPIQRLNDALTYLRTNPSEFSAFYEDFVNDLIWDEPVAFNEASEAFCALASQLLNAT